MFGRQKVAALVAEFLGAGVLTLLLLSVQRSQIGLPFFVSIAAGLTITLLAFAFNTLTAFNPAMTIGLWTARKISTLAAAMYIVMQMLGGWAAYYLYTYYVKSPLQPVGGHFSGRILVAEAVGTAIFSFGLAAAIYQGFSRAVTASVTGLSYLVGILAASSAAIGLLNPAVALGVRAWVWGTYVLGPVLGAVIGVNLYGLLFAEPEALVAGASTTIVSETIVTPAKKPAAKKSAAKKRAASRR